MNTASKTDSQNIPDFCQGIDFFAEPWPDYEQHAGRAVIGEGQTSVSNVSDPNAIYQSLLMADALRYLTLQVTGAKASGHPGGFASSADAYAALGITPSASPAEIKRAYRKLISQNHPDKLAARGLPESMRAVAEERSREINSAYDLIKAARSDLK